MKRSRYGLVDRDRECLCVCVCERERRRERMRDQEDDTERRVIYGKDKEVGRRERDR